VISAPHNRSHFRWVCASRTAPLAGLLALVLAGCGGAAGVDGTTACDGAGDAPTEVVADATTDRLSITNNDVALGGLVVCRNEDVPVEDAAAAGKVLLGGGKHTTVPTSSHGFTLTLVAEVDPPTVVGLPRFIGTGTDDLIAGGAFTGDGPVFYRVEIDGVPGDAPDTFRWSDDGGLTWREAGLAAGTDVGSGRTARPAGVGGKPGPAPGGWAPAACPCGRCWRTSPSTWWRAPRCTSAGCGSRAPTAPVPTWSRAR